MAEEVKTQELPQWFMDGLRTLNDRDQGMSYRGAEHGRTKYDENTGRPYLTRGRPVELTVFSSRASFLYRLINESEKILEILENQNK